MNAESEGQAALKDVKDFIDRLRKENSAARDSVKYWQARFDKAQEAEDAAKAEAYKWQVRALRAEAVRRAEECDCGCVSWARGEEISMIAPDRRVCGSDRGLFAVSWRDCPSCCGTGRAIGLSRDPAAPAKPIRLLVEVVPQKDEKHSEWKRVFEDGSALTIAPTGAMSVQELPAIPSLNTLRVIYEECFDVTKATESRTDGIERVLKACGLEVPE